MPDCFFATDLHGQIERYEKLFRVVAVEKPDALFLGGDLLPSGIATLSSIDPSHHDFIENYLLQRLQRLRESSPETYPVVFAILGNDDGRFEEEAMLAAETKGMWEYAHDRRSEIGAWSVYGYSFVPPSPFQLKDWERYDVSRFVDPGCVSPEEGIRTVVVPPKEQRHATIQKDLDRLAGSDDLSNSIFLFHSPPYQTNLDRAALDGRMIDHAPVDVHVGSVAIKRFIEARRPLITLHGHVHESARLTGSWKDRIGETYCFSAAHDGPELALVKFDPDNPAGAARILI